MAKQFDNFDFGVRAGASLIKHSFCFDNTSSSVLCCCGSSVVVYSVKTGEQIQRLVEESEVISVVLNPKNPLQAVICTVEGIVSYWDYEDGLRLKSAKLSRQDVRFFHAFNGFDHLSWCYSALDSDKNFGFHLVSVKPTKVGDQQMQISEFQLLRSVPEDDRRIAVNTRATCVAFVGEGEMDGSTNSCLFIKSFKKENTKIFKHFVTGSASFTCVTFHPDSNLNCLATGDSQGKILIWYDFLNSQPQKNVCHWHSTPVNALMFSSEGSVLFSGGDESVLVKWPVRDGGGKDKQDFLPRLGAPIQRIAIAQESGHVAIGCADNGVRVISSQSQVLQLLQGLVLGAWKPPVKLNSIMPAGLTCDYYGSMGQQTKNCLITNGRPGEVQFYSPSEDRQLFSIDVVAQNLPPATRDQVIVYTEVVKIASTYGWLATLQLKPSEDLSAEMVLKFWEFSVDKNEFVLNTAIDFPHSNSVTAMEFTPYDPEGSDLPLSLVTTGLDGKFKVWTIENNENAAAYGDNDSSVSKYYWTCERVGFYQNRPAHCCCFSTDGGSVLAVGFGSTLTLWQFSNNHLLAALPVTSDNSELRHLEFGNGQSAHLLLCSSEENVVSFDIISLAVLWRLPLAAVTICRDPSSSKFAIFTSTMLIFMELQSSRQLHKVSLPDCSVVSAAFIPIYGDNSIAQLYFVDSQQKLICYGPKQESADSEVSRKIQKTETPFSSILAMSKAGTRTDSNELTVRLDHKHNLAILESPAHTLPGLKSLAPTFIHSCLIPKSNHTENLALKGIASPGYEGKKKSFEDSSVESSKKRKKRKVEAEELDFSWLSEMFANLAK